MICMILQFFFTCPPLDSIQRFKIFPIEGWTGKTTFHNYATYSTRLSHQRNTSIDVYGKPSTSQKSSQSRQISLRTQYVLSLNEPCTFSQILNYPFVLFQNFCRSFITSLECWVIDAEFRQMKVHTIPFSTHLSATYIPLNTLIVNDPYTIYAVCFCQGFLGYMTVPHYHKCTVFFSKLEVVVFISLSL